MRNEVASTMAGDEGGTSVDAVYELREAAIEHGKAIAALGPVPSRAARDEVLATQTRLEEKTVAAIDECSENAEEASEEACEHAAHDAGPERLEESA